ncbi:HEAT repeat domain-containing protein [Vulgatibacter incomptus]|uniref:HEAT repeat domain-containing protein n=1 Tax=Vulgatibacter incomptus TaxID=1391653 RepID=A0A0K1P9Y4_9BACT|nr:HEAT repeat domain-containing protein [Vulgatibacter incomptus]AKU89929.1 hypothetical protein AKJ08_0316 [Vulgatibacter incomptus]
MGLFDFLGGSKEDRETKKIRELSKKTQEKYGDPATRARALEGLRDIGTPAAIGALLQRFGVKTEPGITDAEEKEYTLSLVTSFGDKAVEPVLDFIRRSDNVAWAVRCLDELVPEPELVTLLSGILQKLSQEYARDPEKKVVLVNRLSTVRDPAIVPVLLPLLEDPSDEVRTSTLNNLVSQDATSAAGAIADCLVQAEAPRVRAAAAAALADLAAPVEDRRDALAGKLPAGFALDKDGIVRRS